MDLHTLAHNLVTGCAFYPGVLVGGVKAENWVEQQLFALDFDHVDQTMEEIYQSALSYDLVPVFMYRTYSYTDEDQRCRMVFCADEPITDGDKRDKLNATLMGLFGNTDVRCKNRNRLFLGSSIGFAEYENYDARINPDAVIATFWDDKYDQYIPHHQKAKKSSSPSSTSASNTVETNAPLIATLNVEGLRHSLLSKSDTNKEELISNSLKYSLLSVSSFADTSAVTVFDSKNQFWDFVNHIDLWEYLGVPNTYFNCVLPDHEDHNPSAHIFMSDSGMPLYYCNGCGRTRTIITLTEALAGCSRAKAIEFVKAVYRIDYKPTEWVSEQREIFLDAIHYLNSESFRLSFPFISKRLGKRKGDLINILLYMMDLVTETLQVDGRPICYCSISTLMKVCGKKNRNQISQSITLFALLSLIEKVPLERVPQEELDLAMHYASLHGFSRLVNFFRVPAYDLHLLESSEKKAQILIANNLSMKGLSREYVLRTFGRETADEVFPQYYEQNASGTSQYSDEKTASLATYVAKKIAAQGYVMESIMNRNDEWGRQWKRSIQELLDTYGWQRIRLNKELKKKYGIECKGWPYIIMKDETLQSDGGEA